MSPINGVSHEEPARQIDSRRRRPGRNRVRPAGSRYFDHCCSDYPDDWHRRGCSVRGDRGSTAVGECLTEERCGPLHAFFLTFARIMHPLLIRLLSDEAAQDIVEYALLTAGFGIVA